MKTIQGYTYKVNEYIGKGYSSTVHKGLNDTNGEEVSIKVIQMAKLQDPINQMLLQLQVSALKALTSSKHVLHLFDVYATRNNTYLITQLCEGDLANMLKLRKTIPYYEAVEIMRQLIQGYYDIHKAGYIHRDIKPANIFYKNGIYMYGDFGFTIPISDIPSHKNYNVGSPVYMPPEALKENIYSVSCDVWAIGIIFYQLLKGMVPWRAVSEKVLYDKMINEPIDSLTVGLPDVARAFLAQILCLDQKQRLTPQKLLGWPNQLQAVPMDIRSVSPFELRGRSANPLRQISITPNNISCVKPSAIFFNNLSVVSPYNNENKPTTLTTIKDHNRFQSLMAIKQPTDHIKEDHQFKQAYFMANNCINFVKFLHRVIKFIAWPNPVELSKLQNSITKYMFNQIFNIKTLLQNKSENIEIKVDGWTQFLKTSKGNLIQKKLKNYQNKYKMFHDNIPQSEQLQQHMIMDGINALMSHLDVQQNFKPKLVVAADYLTTLYQLLHLKSKYSIGEFVKISKIDLIMQGNPYNTGVEHLQKLRKKLMLIRP